MSLPSAPNQAEPRPRWRTTGAKCVLVGLLVLQAFLIVRGGTDPHKLFGFRPFNESDTWSAEIIVVGPDGQRTAIDSDSWPYEWNELVGSDKIRNPQQTKHAKGGADAIVDYLDRSLDWVVDRLAEDGVEVSLEATVTVYRNTRGPETIELQSGDGS